MDTILTHHWDKRLILTVAKIKAFFQLKPQKMEEAIRSCELEVEDVLKAEEVIIASELEANAQSLQDIDGDIQSESDGDYIQDSNEGIMV